MIKANHSLFHSWLINQYTSYILNTDFQAVKIKGDIIADDRSVLLIPNHFSWWDGFFGWHINQNIFRKKFHVMMLEQELSQRMFFSRVGAFSVNLGSRSIIESLNYSIEILESPSNLLLMFPQGKLESQHVNVVKFHKGIERIAGSVHNTRIIFAVCLTDYFSNRKPTLTISLKEYNGTRELEIMQQEFNNHLQHCIVQQDINQHI